LSLTFGALKNVPDESIQSVSKGVCCERSGGWPQPDRGTVETSTKIRETLRARRRQISGGGVDKLHRICSGGLIGKGLNSTLTESAETEGGNISKGTRQRLAMGGERQREHRKNFLRKQKRFCASGTRLGPAKEKEFKKEMKSSSKKSEARGQQRRSCKCNSLRRGNACTSSSGKALRGPQSRAKRSARETRRSVYDVNGKQKRGTENLCRLKEKGTSQLRGIAPRRGKGKGERRYEEG